MRLCVHTSHAGVEDDLDLPFCVIRSAGRWAGGQRGMGSIIKQLGTEDFPRLRSHRRPPGRMDPAAYVLQQFSSKN